MTTTKQIARMFIFRSESKSSAAYQTLIYIDGSASCDCPAWKFKKKTTGTGERTCKHIRLVEAGLAHRHAEKTVEYDQPFPAPAANIRRVELSETPGPGRYISLED